MKRVHRPLVVGNWKMNPQSIEVVVRLGGEIKKRMARIEHVEVVLAPPAIFLPALFRAQNGSDAFRLGAQNVHADKLGAHTGEISIPMLKEFHVSHVIIGHSERRRMGESDNDVHEKINAVIKAGMTPVVCIGETTRDHAANYLGYIENQIRSACAGLTRAKLENLVVAYEPIWAIGTGNTATPEDVHEMKLFIQKVLTDLYSRNFAEKVRILYGGSVNAKNAADLMREGTVDGFLVGGASLHADEFITIVKSTQ